jgi:hypothetical protein
MPNVPGMRAVPAMGAGKRRRWCLGRHYGGRAAQAQTARSASQAAKRIPADFLISLRTYSPFHYFPCACPVMVAGVFVYAKQPVIGMGSS